MTRKFEFRKETAELDIAGHLFSLEVNGANTAKLKSWGEEALRFADSMKTEATEQGVEEATDFLLDSIDEMLGDGAADQIFIGREPEFFDALDVMNYITEEYKACQKQRFQAMPIAIEGTPLNREQRRRAKRNV